MNLTWALNKKKDRPLGFSQKRFAIDLILDEAKRLITVLNVSNSLYQH